MSLKTVAAWFNIPPKTIRKFIPPHPKTRPPLTLRVLLLINYHPGATILTIQKITNSNNESAKYAIEYLLTLGYLTKKQKPYCVTGIKTWRIDSIYTISSTGFTILKQLEQVAIEIEQGLPN